MSTDGQQELVKKIEEIIETQEKERFTEEERQILHKMIDLWKAFDVFGRVANGIRNILIYLAALIGLLFTFSEYLSKYLKHLLGLG